MSTPIPPGEKVKTFPEFPGVYLMKDAAGTVIYVGKAKNLRSRASSYFMANAKDDPRLFWIDEVKDIDFIQTASEVDALLYESRLIKDLQPKNNRDLKDSKTFPYLQINTYEQYPHVEATRKPRDHGVKLYGPFVQSTVRQTLVVLQKIFKFRTCKLNIDENEENWRFYRPCLLASIGQCTAPCNFRVTREEYRKQIHRLQKFLEGPRVEFLDDLTSEMLEAARLRRFEEAARIRDEIAAIETLDLCGDAYEDVQPEAFVLDTKRGVLGLQKVLHLAQPPRIIEGCDIAHLQGDAMVASLVQFIDGLPFKPGYRHFKIKTVEGINDFASIAEVVSRRFRAIRDADERFPDVLVVDGGKIQLRFALDALAALDIPDLTTTVISLAKRDEEIYLPGQEEPLRLSKHALSLRLLQAVRDESHRFAQHYHHILRKKEIE